MRSNGNIVNKKTRVKKDGTVVELVPPDGGWGYMICAAVVIVYVTSTGPLPAFGLIYNDFLEEMGQGTSGITIMQSVASVVNSVSAVVASMLLRRFSMRQVGVVGAIGAVLGMFLTIFVTSISEMILFFSIQAAAWGLLMPIIYTSFNSYFIERRVFTMSICKGIIGIILMIYPLFVGHLMETYGFRGTLAILCAIGGNCILAMTVIQPVENHLIEKVIDYSKMKNATKNVETNIEINIEDMDADKTPGIAVTEAEKEEEEGELKLLETPDRRLSIPLLLSSVNVRRPSVPIMGARQRPKTILRMDTVEVRTIEDHIKTTSMHSLGSFESLYKEPPPHIVDKKGNVRSMLNFKDFSLVKDPIFMNICVGKSFCLFADVMFTVLLPLMLLAEDFTKDQVAYCLSAYAAGDMAARFILALVSRYVNLRARKVFYLGAVMGFILRIILDFFTRFNAVMMVVVFLGATKSLTQLTSPLILAEYVSIDMYPAAYSVYIVMLGVINVTLAPVVGFVRDATGSYNIAFYLLTASLLICIIPWTIEFIIMKRRLRHVKICE